MVCPSNLVGVYVENGCMMFAAVQWVAQLLQPIEPKATSMNMYENNMRERRCKTELEVYKVELLFAA